MHSSGIRTARSLTISRSIQWAGGLPNYPRCRLSWMQTPLPEAGRPLSWRQTPPEADPFGCRPPMNRMTHRCENITLPQILFAGGNKTIRWKQNDLSPWQHGVLSPLQRELVITMVTGTVTA